MTDKQKAFADQYLIDLNATRAYKAVYKTCKKEETAQVNSCRLLSNAKVAEYIQERKIKRTERTEIAQDETLQNINNLTRANITDVLDIVEKSYMKPICDSITGEKIDEEEVFYKAVEVKETKDLPDYVKYAIASIEQTKDGIKIRMHDKVKALELQGRHQGLFNDKLEIRGNLKVDNPYANLSEEDLIKLAKL